MRPLARLNAAAALSAVLLVPSPASADVLLVDPAGYGDFTDIQAAVDASLDGDTIFLQRLHDVTFPGFPVEVNGKAITISAAPGLDVRITSLKIRGLGEDQAVFVSNLRITNDVEVQGNLGNVVLQNCRMFGEAGCRVRNSNSVVLNGCTIQSRIPDVGIGDGRPGVDIERSRVWIHGCTISGGEGASPCGVYGIGEPGQGAAGIRARQSILLCSSTTTVGGRGGSDFTGKCSFLPSEAGNGGAGIEASADSVAYSQSSSIVGGEAGRTWTDLGVAGLPVMGTVQTLAGEMPRVSAPSRGLESHPVPLTFNGQPGDRVVLLVGARFEPRWDRNPGAILSVPIPTQSVPIGMIPPSGELTFDFIVPDVAPNGTTDLILQPTFRAPDGSRRIGNAAHLIALDEDALPWLGERAHVIEDAIPGGDARTWATATADLRELLLSIPDLPDYPVEVWIAEGKYTPAPPFGDREQPFEVFSGAQLYGGFRGTESERDQRAPGDYRTILSGDLNGDDGEAGAWIENSRRLIVSRHMPIFSSEIFGADAVRFDGLHFEGVVSDGQNTGIALDLAGETKLVNCSVTGIRGDAIASADGEISIEGCRIERCFGGISLASRSGTGRAQLSNSLIARNLDTGVWFDDRLIDARLTNCTVVGNESQVSFRAGGVVGPATISNCILWANSLPSGASGFDAQVSDAEAVEYSCVQGLAGQFPEAGNIGEDPAFIRPIGPGGSFGGKGSNLDLRAISPCVDAGANTLVPFDLVDADRDGITTEATPFDLGRRRRFVDNPWSIGTGQGDGPVVDMGAFEWQRPRVVPITPTDS